MKILMSWSLLLWLCWTPVWAEQVALTEPALLQELQQLEENPQPQQVFHERVAALVALRDSYPAEVQGRITRLQCWAQPADRDEEYQSAVIFADRALALARARKDRVTESGLLACRGFHQQLLGNMQQAGQDYDEALTLARRLGDNKQRADILSLRGEMYSYQGEMAEGLMELMDAHRRYEEIGLDSKGREVLAKIANAYRRMGLFERAEGYFQELEYDFRTRNEQESLIEIRSQQGLLYSEMGEYDRALPLMAQAEQYYQGQQQRGMLAWSQIEMATILLHQGKTAQAQEKLEQASRLLHQGEGADSVTRGHWHIVMATVQDAMGQSAKALHHLALAEPIFAKEQNLRFLAWIHEVRARVLERQGRIREALTSLKQFVQTKQALEQMLREQRSLQLRFEFDLARKELENQALRSNQQLQAEKLKQLQERRYWQYLVVILLILVMGILVIHQRGRTRKMHRLAMTDELTGIHNRRQIQAKGRKWFSEARESGKPLCVLLLDIDHFKKVNDQLGHHVGDRVLTAVAQCIEDQLRSLDRVGRNGGEEFLVLLPDTRIDEAAEVAERIRQQVSLLRIEGVPEDHPIHVSIGCAQYRRQDDNLGELVRRADEAMYLAKQSGRNRVVKAQ
ncbi:tetratricopeptide repeat-containing diguanylate cyclase [Aeromonas tecta]|uniref:tetratricopeptide repeat-containing diguanylate cyclase n=1 Tax=Aeromonas tecta TaxID=324617 RepID=UPI000680FFE4|nr:tetratricopeptide repeat-containing diguanylate cyclase [Aeromonas tecta]